MRLGVLREIKNIHKFFDNMERSIKTRNPDAIQRAYTFLKALVYHMDEGDLTPFNIELYHAIELHNQEDNNEPI